MSESGSTAHEPEGLKRMDIRYMHRPPRIVPNYGRRIRSILPKSNVPRVLLYDNVTQEQMLEVKLSSITSEKQKTMRILELHKKAFLLRRLMKHQRAQETKTVTNVVLDLFLPIILDDDGGGIPRRPTMVHSSAGEYTTRKESIRLPSIENGGGTGTVGFKETISGGFTRMMHTIKSPRLTRSSTRSADITGCSVRSTDSGRKRAKRRTVLDKRFRGLEDRLVPLECPGNGYIELSPSYRRETPKLPAGLVSVRVEQTTDSNTVQR